MRAAIHPAALTCLLLALPMGVESKKSIEELIRAYDVAPEAESAHPAAAPPAPRKAHDVAEPDAWGRLLSGNRRFRSGAAGHPNQNLRRRAELAQGQKPVAAVLSCADSRVSPELVFDQGLGDLFVVRVAGNVAGPFDRASLEYAVEHLGVGLLVVMGHERCGAVKAALETAQKPSAAEGLSPDLKALVAEISPAISAGAGEGALDEGVVENARRSAKRLLAQSELLNKAVQQGHLKVKVARYDLDSGAVEALEP